MTEAIERSVMRREHGNVRLSLRKDVGSMGWHMLRPFTCQTKAGCDEELSGEASGYFGVSSPLPQKSCALRNIHVHINTLLSNDGAVRVTPASRGSQLRS